MYVRIRVYVYIRALYIYGCVSMYGCVYVRACVSRSSHSQSAQVALALELEAAGADIIQTEGGEALCFL